MAHACSIILLFYRWGNRNTEQLRNCHTHSKEVAKPRFTPTQVAYQGCPVMLLVHNSPANAGDMRDVGLIPGLGRSPGGGNGNPLQFSCLENPMDRGAQCLGSQRVGHDQSNVARKHTGSLCWGHAHVFTSFLFLYSQLLIFCVNSSLWPHTWLWLWKWMLSLWSWPVAPFFC